MRKNIDVCVIEYDGVNLSTTTVKARDVLSEKRPRFRMNRWYTDIFLHPSDPEQYFVLALGTIASKPVRPVIDDGLPPLYDQPTVEVHTVNDLHSMLLDLEQEVGMVPYELVNSLDVPIVPHPIQTHGVQGFQELTQASGGAGVLGILQPHVVSPFDNPLQQDSSPSASEPSISDDDDHQVPLSPLDLYFPAAPQPACLHVTHQATISSSSSSAAQST